MIEIKQTLNGRDIVGAARLHYNKTAYGRLRWLFLVLLSVSGFLEAWAMGDLRSAVFLFLIAIIWFFFDRLLAQITLSGAKSGKLIDREMRYLFKDEGSLEGRQGENESRVMLNTLYGYRENDEYILLYLQKRIWLIIKKSGVSEEDAGNIVKLLDICKVKRLGK